MSRLASVIKPELAVITNIGLAHLETLRTIENVVRAKFELIDRLPVGAIIVLNADDPRLMREARRRNLDFIGFGIENECEFRATDIMGKRDSGVTFVVNGRSLSMPVFGRVNIYNALAAIAASSAWDCTPDDWTAGLSEFRPLSMRFEIEEHGGIYLIIDCYNANPASVKSSLQALSEFDVPGKKIAILGDMLELGSSSNDLHREAGMQAAHSGVDFMLCLGSESRFMAEGAISAGMNRAAISRFTNHQDLLDKLLTMVAAGDLVLCKGSRGMQLEKIIIGLKGAAFKNN
jgi:UDP-N-acetylmuramyl pentapeptide synthase